MRRDLEASGLLSVLIMGSRILGLVREMVFGALFGARAIGDAFQIAFRIPNLLRDLLAEGALSSAFVPTFTSALEHDGEGPAYRLGNLVLGLLLALTGTLTVLGMVFAEPIVSLISADFAGDADKLALSTRLTRVMMPILVLVSVGAVWMGMLNAQRRFAIPALAPALFNVVTIVVAAGLWWVGLAPERSIAIWAGGTLLAGLAQAALQGIALRKLGYRVRPTLRGAWHHPGVRRIAALMAPALVGVAAVQLNVFINSRFAAALGDGPVSQLSYAFRLFFLPLGMFGVALGVVNTTSVSEAAAKADRNDMAQRCLDTVAAGWMLTSASAVGLFVLAEPIVTLLFRRGAITTVDAGLIAQCLQAYVVGLVPYSLVKIIAPSYYGVDRPRVPLVASMSGVAVNITFNALTHQTLGAPGIALGTALGAMVNVGILWGMYGRIVARAPRRDAGRRWAALVLGNALLGGLAWGLWQGWAQLLRVGSVVGTGLEPLGLALGLVFVIALAGLVYILALRALGYPGAQLLLELPRRVLRRAKR